MSGSRLGRRRWKARARRGATHARCRTIAPGLSRSSHGWLRAIPRERRCLRSLSPLPRPQRSSTMSPPARRCVRRAGCWPLVVPLTQASLPQLKRGSRSETIEGSSLGKSHIAQVVNALENHRLNHEHEYPRDHETRTSLRKDARIRAFESASKHNEPSRIERSQAIKAAGTTSGGWQLPSLLQ